jgi:hypothetical protein
MNIVDLTQIARSPEFQRRVEYLMVEKAIAVNASNPTSADAALIQKVLNGSEPILPWAIAALTDATIAAGTHNLDGSTITDASLRAQVGEQWAAFTL